MILLNINLDSNLNRSLPQEWNDCEFMPLLSHTVGVNI